MTLLPVHELHDLPAALVLYRVIFQLIPLILAVIAMGGRQIMKLVHR